MYSDWSSEILAISAVLKLTLFWDSLHIYNSGKNINNPRAQKNKSESRFILYYIINMYKPLVGI